MSNLVDEEILNSLAVKTDSRLVLLVIDGVGGLEVDGRTELEAAHTPNLDQLCRKCLCGVSDPVSPGVTPGSGPAHLALFGYDPLRYRIGRGVLEALGVGLELTPRDLATRANFATMDAEGVVVDRRAGRIPTQETRELCRLIQSRVSRIDGVEITLTPGREHRFVVVFSGEGLSDELTDTDPQKVGERRRLALALSPEAEATSKVVNRFVEVADQVLSGRSPANSILLRGFSKYPDFPSMADLFKLTPAAIAAYPMYKGLARLAGMELLDTGESIEGELSTLKENFDSYDFFYLHLKRPDLCGEDGDFRGKVKSIEEVDRHLPSLLALRPDVLVVTGDHSTPSLLKSHSWHPNPFMLYSQYCRADGVRRFSERECMKGGLGRFPALEVLPLMLANGLKLKKYGA